MADVRRGIWKPAEPAPVHPEPAPEPTFHEFASEWFEGLRHEGLRPSTWNASNVRNRVLARSIERASETLVEHDRAPLPEGLTPHSLRRTYISLLLALGADVPYVMAQVGHADPKVTLAIYAQVMFRGEGERERLRALLEGDFLGTNGH